VFTVSNPKVAGFTPVWAPFRGFSLLFDNPCDGQRPLAAGIAELAVTLNDDPQVAFYRTLATTLERLDLPLLTSTYLFCPLPTASYHVTVWDGGNAGNLKSVVPARRPELETLLAGLPQSILAPGDLTALPLASSLVTRQLPEIRFRFDALALWGNAVLVARLSPADATSVSHLGRLTDERRRLSANFHAAFGIAPGDRFTPHVSLGYFANPQGALLASHALPTWNAVFDTAMESLNVSYRSISLYGFTDMATFFKAVK